MRWGDNLHKTQMEENVCVYFFLLFGLFMLLCVFLDIAYILWNNCQPARSPTNCVKQNLLGTAEVGIFFWPDALLLSNRECQTSAVFICVKGYRRFSLVICVFWFCGSWGQHKHACDSFPSVLRHCWLGDRKGIRPVIKLDVGLLVVMIWLELSMTYSRQRQSWKAPGLPGRANSWNVILLAEELAAYDGRTPLLVQLKF